MPWNPGLKLYAVVELAQLGDRTVTEPYEL
jgi:hypothetical protein